MRAMNQNIRTKHFLTFKDSLNAEWNRISADEITSYVVYEDGDVNEYSYANVFEKCGSNAFYIQISLGIGKSSEEHRIYYLTEREAERAADAIDDFFEHKYNERLYLSVYPILANHMEEKKEIKTVNEDYKMPNVNDIQVNTVN